MTSAEDRLFVAAALLRQLVSAANVRDAIEARFRGDPARPISDFLIERGALSAEDKTIFLRFLQERIAGDSDHAKGLEPLLQRRIQEALQVVEDPAVRCFLIGDVAGPASVELRSTSTFQLERIYDEGGLGQIWLAAEQNTGRQVAVKRIKPDARSETDPRRRFIQEAKVSSKLQHPNIVPIYHLGITSGNNEPYYAMPFIRGRTLDDVVCEHHETRKGGSQDPGKPNRLLSIFLKICDAVSYANSVGIVHRDLKPQNVMVGTFGEVFVLDWGLAKNLADESSTEEEGCNSDSFPSVSENDSATQAGTILGSPLYMAPEQAAGRADAIDARTDVYGLGGILYKILCGKAPHARDARHSPLEHFAKIQKEPVPSVARQGLKVPPALAAICDKTLALDPADRYQNASELKEDVERWLVGSPVSVYREPALRTIARWALRHRRLSSVAAGIVILLIITTSAVFASAWAYGKATLKHHALSLELHSNQVVKSIQGDVDWAFRYAIGMAERLQFVELLASHERGHTDKVTQWNQVYRPIVESFIQTENYFHSVLLFTATNPTVPIFRFDRPNSNLNDVVEKLFEEPYRAIVIDALGQVANLKPGERWCSNILVVHRSNDTLFPVLLGGYGLFADGKVVGQMLAIIDFHVPLQFVADNLHLSEGIELTNKEGKPFFYFDLDEKRRLSQAYVDLPPIPPSIEKFLRQGQLHELHLDFPDKRQRQLICVRKSPILPNQPTPYLGIILLSDQDQVMIEPRAMRWWIAGVITVVVLSLMVATWLIFRAITALALG
ncbi:MAG: serine/threonine-protein kinase [Planctomycetota bacterium]